MSQYTWQVEGTIPAESNGRPWNRNVNLQVIAIGLEEAVEAAKSHFPDITLHKCWRDRHIEQVIVARQDDHASE